MSNSFFHASIFCDGIAGAEMVEMDWARDCHYFWGHIVDGLSLSHFSFHLCSIVISMGVSGSNLMLLFAN